MARIFISHSSNDNDVAAELVSWLKAQGFETLFLDFDRLHGIPPGDDWEQRLYSEIQKSSAVILLLTRNWFDSKWCFVEFTHARALGKSVLPVVVAPNGDQFIGDNLQKIFLTTNRDDGLTRLLHRLNDIALVGPEGFVHPTGRPPYPGMMSFEEEDAAVFFGRGPETRETLEQLERIRRTGSAKVLQVYGESGSGKSSLLKAGLIPQLKRRQSEWIVVPVFRPGPAPLRELRAALRAASAVSGSPIAPEDADRIDAFLAEPTPAAAAALVERLRDLRAGKARHDATVLFSIDQFEEAANVAAPADRDAFLRALTALLAPDLRTSAIITLRAADLPQIGRLLDLPSQERLIGPFPLDRLPEIVRKPAEAVNLKIEDTLIAAIQRDATSADALPLVAFLLRRLYDRHGDDHRLTKAEYDALADARSNLTALETCIRDAADEAIRRCNPSDAERAALRDVFVPGLVRIEETSGLHTRRPLPAADVSQQAARLVNALVDERLLVRRDDGSIEVAHEALFRVWTPLRAWLEDEQEFLLALNRLEAAVSDWRAAPQPQRQAALLTGLLLDRCADWLSEKPARFTPEQRGFIEASVQACDAAKRRRARARLFVTVGSLSAAIALSILALFANAQRTRALEQEQAAIASATQALQREQEAFAATREARWQTYVSDIRLAESQINAGHVGLARATLDRAPEEWRNWEHGYLRARADSSLLVMQGDQASFSPDGRRIVTASEDGTARLWDASTGSALAELNGHTQGVRTASFSPDGTRIVTASDDGTARVWDASTGSVLTKLRGHANGVIFAAFSPSGKAIVTASHDGTGRVWPASLGWAISELRGHKSGVRTASFSPDGTRIVTATWDNAARVWSPGGWVLAELEGHTDSAFSAAFSPDGTRIVTASWDHTARVWDASTGLALAILRGHTGWVVSAAFSPDGARIVTASLDGTARVWEASTSSALGELRGHTGYVVSAAFSPDGTRIVTASFDGTARVWEASTSSALAELTGHTDKVDSAAFSPDGTRIITASPYDHTARVWDASSGSALVELLGHTNGVKHTVFSPDGTRIVTASNDGTARVWDAATGASLAELKGHTESVNSASFSPDGTRVVTASWDNTARVWDAATGASLAELKGHTTAVTHAAFSPDGTRIVTESSDCLAQVWDAFTGSALVQLKWHGGFLNVVHSSALSPDGRRIVTASEDGTARLWDASTGLALAELNGHTQGVRTASFSPDGTRIVTASDDGTARVWDASAGSAFAELKGHTDKVVSAAFSPDGMRIVTASEDGTARVWDASTGSALAELRGHTGKVNSAVFSPDATRIVTASSEDHTARVWDTSTGSLLAELPIPSFAAASAGWGDPRDQMFSSADAFAVFSPDGTRIVVTASDNKTARVWDSIPAAERYRQSLLAAPPPPSAPSAAAP